jgi:hypothetical protein
LFGFVVETCSATDRAPVDSIPALFVRYQLPECQDVGTAGTDAYWCDVLFLLLSSLLSSSPFGVIFATVAVVVTVVLVAPAAVALAAFIVALAVVATTFLAIDVSLVVDCCVLLPHEEDHPSSP